MAHSPGDVDLEVFHCECCNAPGTIRTLRRPHGVGWWCQPCRDEYDAQVVHRARIPIPSAGFTGVAWIASIVAFGFLAPSVLVANIAVVLLAYPVALFSTVAIEGYRRRKFVRSGRRLPRVEVRELPGADPEIKG